MLRDLDEEPNGEGTSLVFAELKDPVRAKLERYEVGPPDPAHVFPTLEPGGMRFARTPAPSGQTRYKPHSRRPGDFPRRRG